MSDLAIDGGKPIRKSLLNYAHQSVDLDDAQEVLSVLQGDWLTTGPKVEEFERALQDYTGAKEAVAVSSGTAALHAAAFSVGISAGDEVIMPPLTFVASSNCILYMGGKPVFADVRQDTLNLDPVDVELKIGPRTRALLAVDFCGQPCDHDALRELATRHGLVVIEDAAHALGGVYRGRKVGSLQSVTTLSFHPAKQITTGEGGMVLTDDSAIAERARSFRHHGIDLDFRQRGAANLWLYDVINLGYNYRITDISCALGISQLRKLDGWLERRREIARRYDLAFSHLTEVEIPAVDPDCESAWHLYVIRLNLELLRHDREGVFRALRAENIGVNVHYIPIPWLSLYRELGYQRGECPVAERSYERMITLPLYAAMSDRDVTDVIEAVQKVISAYRV